MAIEPKSPYSDHLSLLTHTSFLPELCKHQKDFDESDIYIALANWGIGVASSNEKFEGMNSYEKQLGAQAAELTALGLVEGRDLRAIGVDSDLKFYCQQLEDSTPDQRALFIAPIIEHLMTKMQTWEKFATQEELNLLILQLQEFCQTTRTAAETRELTTLLIETFHAYDLKVLRTHILEMRHPTHAAHPCSSSQCQFPTITKVQSITKQFQLLAEVQIAAANQVPEELQIILIRLREECPSGTGELLIKKIYQHTRNLLRQQKKTSTLKRYGCLAFLNLEGCTTTRTQKIEVVNRARATLLLPVIKTAIQQDQYEDLEHYLFLIKQITLEITSGCKASLETVLYKQVWLAGGRPARDPIAYGYSALTTKTLLSTDAKLTAIDRTIDLFKKHINE